jgi:fructokinase
MTTPRIIGIGETVLDILFKNDQPLKAVPGGSTFNSIVSLGRAGMNCVMVTDVGGDHVGDLICNYLQENGVSSEYVCRHENVKSHITLAFLNEHNDAQYVFYKDHASVSLDGPLPTFSKNDVVLFGSFFAINSVIRPVVGSLLRKAHEAGAWLYYDVNFRKNHIADLPDVMLNIEENMRLANVVRGSMEDFGYLLGLHDGDAIYERVSRYCHTLILTDGARQIRVYTPESCETYPVQPIETVSTVGAGDNFNAGYIYAKLAIEKGKLKTENSTSAKNNCQLSTINCQLIKMAQRWSQDVCQQLGNNISDELVEKLKNEQI